MKTKTVKKIASILVATALLCPMYVASGQRLHDDQAIIIGAQSASRKIGGVGTKIHKGFVDNR